MYEKNEPNRTEQIFEDRTPLFFEEKNYMCYLSYPYVRYRRRKI
jgi:hypothetical protein